MGFRPHGVAPQDAAAPPGAEEGRPVVAMTQLTAATRFDDGKVIDQIPPPDYRGWDISLKPSFSVTP